MLVDTAGLRESEDVVESIGVGRARDEAERADLLVWLGDPAELPGRSGVILVSPKGDLGNTGIGLPVSALTGDGLVELTRVLLEQARELLPAGDELALDRRQHDLLADAQQALTRGSTLFDPVLIAEELRVARQAVDLISGRAGVEDLLDALFGRFCLGK